jgi:hypothetical protein
VEPLVDARPDPVGVPRGDPEALAAVELEGAPDALGGTLSLTMPVTVAAAELEGSPEALGATLSLTSPVRVADA